MESEGQIVRILIHGAFGTPLGAHSSLDADLPGGQRLKGHDLGNEGKW